MKLTKEDIASVIEMYKSGLSTNKIGDKVGVDADSPTKEMCESTGFWRGMIDGDGSIHVTKKGKLSMYLCGGSIDCIRAFEKWVKSKTDTEANIYKGASAYYFVISGRHAVKVANELYGGNPNYALKRKIDKLKPFVHV